MRVAFDYGKVLDSRPDLRQTADILRNAGCEVCVLSAMGKADETKIREHVNLILPGVPLLCVFMDGWDWTPGVIDTRAGEAKLVVMLEENIDLLFDDNPTICSVVENGGRRTIRVYPNSEFYFYGPVLLDGLGLEDAPSTYWHLHQRKIIDSDGTETMMIYSDFSEGPLALRKPQGVWCRAAGCWKDTDVLTPEGAASGT